MFPSFSHGCTVMLQCILSLFSTQIFLTILALLLGFGTIVQLQLIPLVRSYLQGTVQVRGKRLMHMRNACMHIFHILNEFVGLCFFCKFLLLLCYCMHILNVFLGLHFFCVFLLLLCTAIDLPLF